MAKHIKPKLRKLNYVLLYPLKHNLVLHLTWYVENLDHVKIKAYNLNTKIIYANFSDHSAQVCKINMVNL